MHLPFCIASAPEAFQKNNYVPFVSGQRRHWRYCWWSGHVGRGCWAGQCKTKIGLGLLSGVQSQAQQKNVPFLCIRSPLCGPRFEFRWYQTRPTESWSNQHYTNSSQLQRIAELSGCCNLLVQIKFIPNMSQKAAALHQLLQNDVDPKELATFSVDASSKGLGAVILQNDCLVARWFQGP